MGKVRVFYGWWVVSACASIIFLTGGTFYYGFSALVKPLQNQFGWSRALISGAFSLRTQSGGLASPVVGYLVDRIGSRRLLLVGTALVGTGFILLSRVESVWAFYATVMVIAVGMSATGGPVAMTAAAHWFERQRGRAMALLAAGAGASGVMVLVLATLIAAFGWREALLVVGIAQWAVCIPLALLVRHRPQEMGLLPDGELALPRPEVGRAAALAEADGVADGPLRLQDPGLTIGQALRTRTFWLLALAMSLSGFGSTAIIVHQVVYVTEATGLSDEQAAVVAMMMPIVSLAGRLGFGWLADYREKRQVLAASYMLLGLGILLLAAAQQPWQLFFFLAVFSPGWGGSIAVQPAFQAESFGLRAFGALQGLAFTVSTLGSVAGPIFAGWVHDSTDTYRHAFVVLAIASLAAAPAILMAGQPRRMVAVAST
jgi:OFA family oxalate/formate antiporter-like MFS transporter